SSAEADCDQVMDMSDHDPRRFRRGEHSTAQKCAEIAGKQFHAIRHSRDPSQGIVVNMLDERRDGVARHAQSDKMGMRRTGNCKRARVDAQEECLAITRSNLPSPLHNNAVASHVDAKEEVIVPVTWGSLLAESAQRSRQNTQAWQKPFRDVEVNGP